jgi:hypothetical protein
MGGSPTTTQNTQQQSTTNPWAPAAPVAFEHSEMRDTT